MQPTPELLNADIIQAALSKKAASLLQKLEIYPKIDSTNNYLLEQAKQSHKRQAVFAEQQMAGRGRNGRQWYSPFACNIYLSILWDYPLSSSLEKELTGFSLATSVAIIQALKNYGVGGNLQVKWPNDIFFQQRKLAGVLIETVTTAKQLHVVVGVGLNVDLSSQADIPVDQPWIDIRTIIEKKPERNILAAKLLAELLLLLENYPASGFISYLTDWQKLDALKDRVVTMQVNGQQIVGLAKGVNHKGELLILTADGMLHNFSHSEARIQRLD